MSQIGWGLVAEILRDDKHVPWSGVRWDVHPDEGGSPLYYWRPDRLFPNVAEAYRFTTYGGYLEYRAGVHSQFLPGKHSRGGGGPSVLTQPPPSSSKKSRGTRRKSCPKGHYWSYKEKKCVKSKFR